MHSVIGKNRRDDYCGQGLLVLLARQKNTPGRAWQRVLFNCPYGHRKNQTYIAAKHPKHFSVKEIWAACGRWPALLFAFFWRCIPAASLAALAESSVQRIGGMIIAANGFCFFLPKQKVHRR
jgi:hypothetical protein